MLGRTSYKTAATSKTQQSLKVGITIITSTVQGFATYKFLMPRNSTIKDIIFYDHTKSTASYLLRYFSGVVGDQPLEQKMHDHILCYQ